MAQNKNVIKFWRVRCPIWFYWITFIDMTGVLNEYILSWHNVLIICAAFASQMHCAKPKSSNLAFLASKGVCNIIVDCYWLCNVYLQMSLALANFITLSVARTRFVLGLQLQKYQAVQLLAVGEGCFTLTDKMGTRNNVWTLLINNCRITAAALACAKSERHA